MAYQSLYRRYRPQRFSEVKGQDHVTTTLTTAVREGRVVHAYLFSGPRGTGKTSSARILAKALNCANPEAGEPCGTCESCVSITEGRSLDVVEMDAASNRGIDAMRDLIARVSLATPGRWKVYIVDEVHMLTTEAANTLLKTLEEPPAHVVFVLATTEAQKILPTIESRTQHFEFRLLPARTLVDHLSWVARDAGLEVAPEAIELVAKRGSGSARDALSALDQVAAAGGIEHEGPGTDAMVEALCDRDAGAALVAAAERVNHGHDPRQIARELIEHLRGALVATIDRNLVGLPDDDLARLEGQARRLGRAAAVRGMEVLGQALVDMREAPDPRVLLDVSLVRLARPDLDDSPSALLDRIERLERALAVGATVGLAVGATVGATGGGGSAEIRRSAPPSAVDGPAVDAPVDGPVDGAVAPTGPTPPAAPAAPVSSGARRALGAVRKATSSPPPPIRPPAAPHPPAGSPAATAPADPVTGTTGPSRDVAGDPPSRDDLTLAWGDRVLASLAQRPRSRFRSGRFVSADGAVARFALPDRFHLERCREFQAEVEAALAAHFGRPVTLELVVDDGPAPTVPTVPAAPTVPGPSPAPPGTVARPPTDVGPPPDASDSGPVDDYVDDWEELTDAPPGAIASPLEHVLAVFEGAEVVEEER